MSAVWHRPQRAEVLPPYFSLREKVAMVAGFVGLIIVIRLSRLIPK